MNDFSDAIRLNPQAAQDMDSMKEELDTLHKLREAGLVRGESLPFIKGRRDLTELKPQKFEKQGVKLTFRV